HLGGRLARGKNYFRHSGAQRTMVVELGKPHILKRQIAQAIECLRHTGSIFANVIEQRFNLRAIHQRPSSFCAANTRIASCITFFNGTEFVAASRRQSSYSGAAFAVSPDCHRAILMRTAPHCVCTSLNSRASENLFSTRQCIPIVVVSRNSTSRSADTRSGRQSTVNCTPVRPFFICT